MHLTWIELDQFLAANTSQNVILYGPPGLGKTSLACRTTQRDPYMITCTEETAAAELRGHYIPKGQEFIWHDGPALLAWERGSRLIVNEIDRASGDALSFLYGLLDDPEVARMSLPTGDHVRPSHGFHAIATTNAEDLESSLPAGVFDRFSVRILIDELHPDALALLPEGVRSACLETYKHEDPERRITFRQWHSYTKLCKTVPASMAARLSFGSRGADILNSLILAGGKK